MRLQRLSGRWRLGTSAPLLLVLLIACDSPPPPPGNQPENPAQVALPDIADQGAGQQTVATDDQSGVLEVQIYYRHPQLEGMVARPKTIFETDQEANLIKQVIDHLTIAPEGNQGEPIWPANTYVREVYALKDGTLVIDFNSSFTELLQVSALDEDFMVFSLVQSLLENFDNYTRVHILVDGEIQETFLGHIDIEFPLGLRKNPLVIIPDPIEEIIVEDLGKPGSQ